MTTSTGAEEQQNVATPAKFSGVFHVFLFIVAILKPTDLRAVKSSERERSHFSLSLTNQAEMHALSFAFHFTSSGVCVVTSCVLQN